jgi:hypothetical protein
VKGAGVDCAMLLKACYVNTGIVPDFAVPEYTRDWMLHRGEEVFLGIVERFCVRVEHPQPGDIAMFRFGLCFSHAGIVEQWPMIIHAYLPERRVVPCDASRGPIAKVPRCWYSYFSARDRDG